MSKIIILDYGDDNINALKAHIEAQGHATTLAKRDTKAAAIRADKDIKGVILAGGPFTVYGDDIDVVDPELFALDIPLLGIGRGMQVMLHQLGGDVTPAGYQYAPTPSALTLHNTDSGIFKGLAKEVVKPLGFDAKVSALPKDFEILASGKEVKSGDNRPFGATENPAKKLYGIQFVVDVAEALDAQAINNFLALC